LSKDLDPKRIHTADRRPPWLLIALLNAVGPVIGLVALARPHPLTWGLALACVLLAVALRLAQPLWFALNLPFGKASTFNAPTRGSLLLLWFGPGIVLGVGSLPPPAPLLTAAGLSVSIATGVGLAGLIFLTEPRFREELTSYGRLLGLYVVVAGVGYAASALKAF
jgi:hypothetical protein